MKYKLKRDCPWHNTKAGTEVLINFADSVLIQAETFTTRDFSSVNTSKYKYPVEKQYIYIGSRERLLEEGWIEEVKPREFYLYYDKFSGEKIFYETLEEAKKDLASWIHTRLIKVREVLDES